MPSSNTHYMPWVKCSRRLCSIQLMETFSVFIQIYMIKPTLGISNTTVLVLKAIAYALALLYNRISVTPFIGLSLCKVSSSSTIYMWKSCVTCYECVCKCKWENIWENVIMCDGKCDNLYEESLLLIKMCSSMFVSEKGVASCSFFPISSCDKNFLFFEVWVHTYLWLMNSDRHLLRLSDFTLLVQKLFPFKPFEIGVGLGVGFGVNEPLTRYKLHVHTCCAFCNWDALPR